MMSYCKKMFTTVSQRSEKTKKPQKAEASFESGIIPVGGGCELGEDTSEKQNNT